MPRDQLTIRPLTTNDADAFKALRLEAISDSPTAIWPTHEEEAQRTPQEIEARLRVTKQQIIFGAFDGHSLVGIAGLRREPLERVEHKAALWGVFVDPTFRGAGIARALLAAVLEHAREVHVLQIHLCVNSENPRAQGLYRSIGFETYGVEPCAMRVGNRYYDEEHMVLRLDAR